MLADPPDAGRRRPYIVWSGILMCFMLTAIVFYGIIPMLTRQLYMKCMMFLDRT